MIKPDQITSRKYGEYYIFYLNGIKVLRIKCELGQPQLISQINKDSTVASLGQKRLRDFFEGTGFERGNVATCQVHYYKEGRHLIDDLSDGEQKKLFDYCMETALQGVLGELNDIVTYFSGLEKQFNASIEEGAEIFCSEEFEEKYDIKEMIAEVSSELARIYKSKPNPKVVQWAEILLHNLLKDIFSLGFAIGKEDLE
ncbi:hypothetical protein Desca_2452 [Desulfotomaculum nigrificans CO-1-SRB]|uniref:Uncharacterized protein n=1 Tax=Desulfotomaculum nigrificans (strain DSM 14880 / VKM B-2319 / CO-1-SRB) TaxID=868595 RepID=F6B4A3_DESCC|nr:hypothetical protein [Desulfotomaculum nigrificans]AEF95280.1 hypothetical protein Desca_2452 [Desulfotomaculum nigrificans CO-1-SRB]